MASPDPEVEFNISPSHDDDLLIDNDGERDNNNMNNCFSPRHKDYAGNAQPCSSSPKVHVPNIKPDTYDGTGSFEQYMSHFDDCAELSNWNERTRVLILASGLRGTARNFYMSLPDSDRRHYSTLVPQLADRFGGSKNETIWLNRLENRRR